MTTNPKIKSDIQSLNPGSEKIELFSLDATAFGGIVYYFVAGTDAGSAVVFNGITYHPLPVKITGVKTSGKELPRPKMTVANVGLTFVGLVNAYQDAVGCKVTRIQTFKKYIDGHAGADSNAQFPADIYYIEQKVSQNKFQIEWELVSPIDVGDRKIPRNQVLNTCGNFYRIYTAGAFDYSFSTCPYTGSGYFAATGVTTTADSDVCGKRLSDCELRYPLKTDELPFKGCPGVGKIGRSY